MEKQIISVIIPLYNRSGFIVEALESIRAQEYRPVEVIVVDDGSTDESFLVATAWANSNRDPGLFDVSVIQQDNQGAPAARNQGFSASSGSLIQFLDSDDLLLPGKFTEACAIFSADSEIDLVYGPWVLRQDGVDRCMWGPDLESRPWVAEVVIKYLWTAAPIYRRNVVDAAGPWNTSLRRSQDREFCARALSHVRRAKRTPEPRSIYRLFVDSSSISASTPFTQCAGSRSVLEADKVMRELVLKESSPLRDTALRSLASRDLLAVRGLVKCGELTLTRKVLLRDGTIWKLGLNRSLEAAVLLGLSLLPVAILQALLATLIRRR
jgi:glycosyltransferase involved in cell wall biosynthesis